MNAETPCDTRLKETNDEYFQWNRATHQRPSPASRRRQADPTATFRVAIDNGPNVETAFVPVEAWGQRAETIASQFAKGDRITLTASLRTSEWETPEGSKKSRTYLNLESFNFIEPRSTTKSAPDRSQPQVQAF